MRNRQMKALRAKLEKLTAGQRKALLAELMAHESRTAVAAIIEGRTASGVHCPHCATKQVVKNGTLRGVQRHLCRGCRRTFGALTGTPLNRLHLRGKWADHAQALYDGLTLKQTAERLNIALSTAHRWRQRFLTQPKMIQTHRLSGIAEADETYFLRSAKGQRKGLVRPARRRGGSAIKRGLSAEQVAVLVARDRTGETADFILESATKETVATMLQPKIATDAILCTDGSATLAAAARELQIEQHAIDLSAGIRVRGAWHIQNVNSHHSRLKGWMGRFRGVATKYLDSYLGWFRLTDQSPRSGLKPTQCLAMALAT